MVLPLLFLCTQGVILGFTSPLDILWHFPPYAARPVLDPLPGRGSGFTLLAVAS